MENKDLLEKVEDLAKRREYAKIRELIKDIYSIPLLASIIDILSLTLTGLPITAIGVILFREILTRKQKDIYVEHLSTTQETSKTYFYRLSNYYFIIDEEYSNPNRESIQLLIDQFIRSRYDDRIEIKIKFEEGSIKTKVILYGTIIFLGIGNYGSFRAGLKDITNDLDYLAIELKDKLISNNHKVREFDGRLGQPSELSELIEAIVAIQEKSDRLTDEECESLKKLKQRLSNLLAISSGQERHAILTNLNMEDLPEPQKEGVELYTDMFAIKEEEEI